MATTCAWKACVLNSCGGGRVLMVLVINTA